MTSSPFLWFLVGTSLTFTQAFVARDNRETVYNGLGAVQSVSTRTAQAPMAYRVLVPAIVCLVPERWRRLLYEVVLSLLAGAAIWTVAVCHGERAAWITAVLLPATMRYDYWCWAPEVAAFAAASSGSWLAVPWVAALAASRETWPAAALLSWDFRAAVAGSVVASAVRWYVGPRSRYCSRVMVRRNFDDLVWWFRAMPGSITDSMTVSVALTVAALAAAVSLGWPTGFLWLAVIMSGWTLAIAYETRVFAPAIVLVAIQAASVF